MRATRLSASELSKREEAGKVDTVYVRTYTVVMNITLSIDEQLVERAREKLRATGKSINQEIREHLEHIVGDEDLELDLQGFLQRVGQGNSGGWKWNRDDAYEHRSQWPRK